jgi:hypothetical protein
MELSNIQTLQNNLRTVIALRPVSYQINLASDKNSYGFIPQEVESILPNLYSGVEYTSIIPFLVGAIQEQQKQIDDLTSQLNTLLSKLGMLII